MALQTATNPDTGDRVAFVNGAWQPITQSATGANGSKAYLINNQWHTDEGPAAPATPAVGTEVVVTPATSGQPIGEVPGPRMASPRWAAAREFVGPAVTTGTTIGGAMFGSLGGPAGTVLGAGAGYGLGEALLHNADILAGNAKAGTPGEEMLKSVGDTLMGMTFEAGGQVAAPYINKALTLGSRGVGWLYDTLSGQLGPQKAADILRKSFGSGAPEAIAAGRKAESDLTARQAVANVEAPAAQALLARAEGRTPEASRMLSIRTQQQEADRLNSLRSLAMGGSQTEARGARQGMKNQLRADLIPTLETEMGAVNTASDLGAKLEAQSQRMGTAAAEKVADVRRMTALSERAGAAAGKPQTAERGMPVPGRYTYTGELAQRAEQEAAKAAEGSLRFGEAARFADAALGSLEAHGLKPLKTDAIVARLQSVLKDPKYAGNDVIEKSIPQVIADIKAWTNSGGVIDAWALDSIRKNSVNKVVRDLYKGEGTAAQNKAAASVIDKIRPILVDAIEKSGGTEYGNYLRAYQQGLEAVSQKKLSAEALRLYQDNPGEFVRLVRGNSPEAVEKIMGPGSYNIVKAMTEKTTQVLPGGMKVTELSGKPFQTLTKAAGEIERDIKIKESATAGQSALAELLRSETYGAKIPAYFSKTTTTINTVLDRLEKKLGTKVMNELTKASESGKNLADLLSKMPAVERNKVLRALNKPEEWLIIPKNARGGAAAGTANALAPESINELRND